MAILKVSCDENVHFKNIRKLEMAGHIEIHATNIEGITQNRKATNKHPPTATIDGRFGFIGSSAITDDGSRLNRIERIIGAGNHGDVAHFEAHLRGKRDVFVTDDNDFLSKRQELEDTFGTRILTTSELLAEFDVDSSNQ